MNDKRVLHDVTRCFHCEKEFYCANNPEEVCERYKKLAEMIKLNNKNTIVQNLINDSCSVFKRVDEDRLQYVYEKVMKNKLPYYDKIFHEGTFVRIE